MNENLKLVMNKFREDAMDDQIYLDSGTMDDEHYIIFDSPKCSAGFMNYAIEVLELDENTDEYDLEHEILETNFVYSDTHTICSECYGVIQHQADSPHWQPDFFMGDGFIVCNNCFTSEKDYQEKYLDDLINNPNKANQLLEEEQLKELGFERVERDFESGLHRGQTDDPKEIYEDLREAYEDILFNIDATSMFDTRFSAWVRGNIA